MNQPFSIGDSFTRDGVSERAYTSLHNYTRTVFTSSTFPVAGQKASEAAFTDSTEEKESLPLNSLQQHTPSVDRAVHLGQLNVHNITQRVLSVVRNTHNSGLSSSVLHTSFLIM